MTADAWSEGSEYDRFMGRWSERVAAEFVAELSTEESVSWLDVGSGTGALTSEIIRSTRPSRVAAVEPSPEFAAAARERLGTVATVEVADATHLPYDDDTFDVLVSGLVLNFLPDPLAGVIEMRRVVRPGGLIAAYVWDYADGMEFLRRFWDTAVGLDPDAAALDEGVRFPLCRPDRLRDLFAQAGLTGVVTGSISTRTEFSDFEDFWTPFLTGQGPAPGYVASLDENARLRLARAVADAVRGDDATITLDARAWTVAGTA